MAAPAREATPALTLRLPDSEATAALGRALAEALRPGDCVLLEGPIGAGKSHLARATIQALLAESGRMEEVPSPTYTLVQTYDTARGPVWHADLYRLGDSGETAELGLDEALGTAIVLIEWPDRMASVPDALHVTLAAEGEGRLARLSGGPRWAEVLAALAEVVR
jgi:tRNA threonylcarbamoyl adenosine modification protein YjeE